MKNKKIILAVISIILIAILTTVSFSATNIRTGMTFEEAVQASKERNNKVENKTTSESNENVVDSNTVKNETVQEKDETDNTVKNEITSNEVETENKIDDKNDALEEKTDDENAEVEEEGIVTFQKTLSEDLVKVGDNVEYKELCIDGNAHIIAEKVVLEDFKVEGNLFIISANIELKNVIVEGSAYIISETVKVDGQIESAYIVSNDVTIEVNTDIIKELRVVSTNFELEGSIGRDLYAYSESLKITDRAEVYGDCIVEASTVDVSEDAKIVGEKRIEIVENTNTGFSINKQYIYSSIIVDCIIILIVAMFVLYSSPKFVAVNGRLRLRDFVKAFFTGLFELILVFIIFIGLSYIGYGLGFGFALLILSILLVYFGKMLFVISAGIRLAGKSENVSEIKAFFAILFILVIVEAISLLELTGAVGLLVSMAIDFVLGITGFGSLVRVVLTPSRKKKQSKIVQKNNDNNVNVREVRPDDFVMKGAPVETKVDVAPEVKESVIQEEKNEIEEVKQEELKEEEPKNDEVEPKEEIEEEK